MEKYNFGELVHHNINFYESVSCLRIYNLGILGYKNLELVFCLEKINSEDTGYDKYTLTVNVYFILGLKDQLKTLNISDFVI